MDFIQGEEIAVHVAAGRKALDLSQTELAARAGVSRGTVSRLENGFWEELSVGNLLAILSVLRWNIVFEPNQLPAPEQSYTGARDFITREYRNGSNTA